LRRDIDPSRRAELFKAFASIVHDNCHTLLRSLA
jgi:hypothetical protein